MFNQLKKFDKQIKTISSVPEGMEAWLLAELATKTDEDILYIAPDGVSLEQTADILRYIMPEAEVLRFPAWDTVPYDRVSPNPEIVAQRVDVLAQLAVVPENKKKRFIITSVGAVLQKVAPKKVFLNSIKSIRKGGELTFANFLHYVSVNGYNRVEQVMEPGEYAVRGDILDIFPVGTPNPLRIDLFGDEVERIRSFDVLTQRTTGELEHYTFAAAGEVVLDENTIKSFRSQYREAFGIACKDDEIYEAVSNGKKYMGMENWLPFFYEDNLPTLFDYVPRAMVVLGRNSEAAMQSKQESVADHYTARLEALQVAKNKNEVDVYRPVMPEKMFLSAEDVKAKANLEFTGLNLPESDEVIDIKAVPGRDFSSAKNVAVTEVYAKVVEKLSEYGKLPRIICCYSAGSREKIMIMLKEVAGDKLDLVTAESWQEALQKAKKSVVLIVLGLAKGFHNSELFVVSEQDIVGAKQNRRTNKKVSAKDFIADISLLNVGELVVHIEHGIGRFMGLENIVAGGADHDCLKILYANDDKLFVPVENIEMISRYGSEDENVVLDVLGGMAWEAKKDRVKKRIRDLAEKLIAVAAQRQLRKAESFVPSYGVYDEFCAGFPYNETDDQLSAIDDVIGDLAAGMPMDRLICGDVGFGKTEVALRAAFTVAMAGGQVAVVVPTTLLARQHYLNFKQRMSGFPLKIGMLSRLTTPAEARKIKEEMKNGSLDIVIGTHALLNDKIEFLNLELLIIDEEQHFGVVHKEKLKALKNDVHVLTLTATPIPRTLQLSLTGVKQLSIIATPPVDRLAARTFVMPFDRVMIKEAIYREKFRGGQTFVVCPRVSDIPEVNKILKEIAPDITILVAHGQMPVRQLEDVMNDFVDKKGDVLLSTTIIESGIDIPSVNTMIVYRADMFGLAQLYQLRGRIGRSKLRGYCYFTVPRQKMLKPLAERRLNILQALDSLGAGFSLASHDMDIRGSGNVLGEEQSGHIKDVGIALYHHMLQEEILRIKNGEKAEEKIGQDWSPQIVTGVPIMIAENYVRDLGVRLGLYKRIGSLETQEELLDMREELVDRFGPIPQEVENLLKTVEIKQLCKKVNVERVDAGAKGFVLGFKDNYFAASEKLLDMITKSGGRIKIRPDQKLFVSGDLAKYEDRLTIVKNFVIKLLGFLN
ncbi:MAG: transcription-repair coupling factor [Alphaproteobacteria bacterium]|nr:transcription-repair coupling factor [Alphaproteobacteria bacterium]